MEDENENEIELELGLSIGRTQKRTKQNEVVSIGNDHQLSFINTQQQEEAEEVVVDPRAKREMQALRRKEVKRKREEKRLLKKRGFFCSNGGEGLCNYVACNGALKNVKFDKLMVEMNVVRSVSGSGDGCGSSFSPASTTSSGSDRWRSPSLDGGNSSENKSHLTQSSSDPPQSDGSKARNLRSESEHSDISQQVVIPAATNQTIPVEANASNAHPSTLSTAKVDDKADGEGADLPQKHITNTENSIPCPMRQCNADKRKPPKPNCIPSTLPLLPCVSTKGNGPNGKTVNGFLYRYTRTEVSIVCVCHGTSFSPAEFVQHAGGTDVMHPLRHITVVPSAF